MLQGEIEQEKKIAGEAAAGYVQPGMVVGLGTGSTAFYAIQALGKRVREGLAMQGIPTSQQTQILAQREGIPLMDFTQTLQIDLTIDGADEIDPQLNLIKGGGGALLREKIIAAASHQMIVIADASKRKPFLGHSPLPVEVTPFGWQTVAQRIEALGACAVLRMENGQPFVSDNHLYILDCTFSAIHRPAELEAALNAIPGAVINGLFVGLASLLIVGQGERIETIEQTGKRNRCPSP